MALADKKITSYASGVSDLPDYPSDEGYSAEQLKAVFDARSDDEIKAKHNGLVDDVIAALGLKANASSLATHTGNTANPHNVTKAQVGLGNVDNTSDTDKPVSLATEQAIAVVEGELVLHRDSINNPHGVTKAQVGLGNVSNNEQATKTNFDNHVGMPVLDHANGSVTTDKLADRAVTEFKLADGSVTQNKIDRGSVTTDKLDDGAVTSDKLAPSAISAVMQSELDGKAPLEVYELIETITLAADTVTIDRTTEPDNTPYNFKEVTVKAHATAATALRTFSIYFYAGTDIVEAGIYAGVNTSDRWSFARIFDDGGKKTLEYAFPSTNVAGGLTPITQYNTIHFTENNITRIRLVCGNNFPAGTEITIEAVRA